MVDNYYEMFREGTDLDAIGAVDNTYAVLHKDIQLVDTGNKRFDRAMQSDDFVMVDGLASYAAAVRIKLQTWYNEMNENPTYIGFGNKAWFYLKAPNTELHRLELEGHIKTAIEEMNRTKSVDSIEIFEYFSQGVNAPSTLVIEVVATTVSDQVGKFTEEAIAYGI